jgi:hypothetical protein
MEWRFSGVAVVAVLAVNVNVNVTAVVADGLAG